MDTLTPQSIFNAFIQSPSTFIGSFCGIAGALLVASNSMFSQYGFIALLISSVLLLRWSIKDRISHQICLNAVFVGVNLFGLYRWFS